jgi:hypothetical protein
MGRKNLCRGPGLWPIGGPTTASLGAPPRSYGLRIEPICPCPRLKGCSPWVAHAGGIQVAFEHFTVPRIIGLGSGRRLPWGLRRSCRGLPLVNGADGGKKPGGGHLRALSRKDCAERGPRARASGSLRTVVTCDIETTDVSRIQGSDTAVHRDHPVRTAVACRTPDDNHDTKVRGDRPVRSGVACRTTDDNHGSDTEVRGVACRTTDDNRGTGIGLLGDRPLTAAVAGRIGSTDVSRGSGTGVNGDRRYSAGETAKEGGTEDRSTRATGARLLESDELFCLGSL